jgi:hypothetical protein
MRMTEKQQTTEHRTIAQLREFLVKLMTSFAQAPHAPADCPDDKEAPGMGPDDRAIERENGEIASLPRFC